MKRVLILLASLVFAFPAQAKWHEAQSENFVIYADESKGKIEKFAEMLERYHDAIELVTGTKWTTPAPDQRLVIYAVGKGSQIRELYGSENVGGFYIPRESGARAFIQEVTIKSGEPDFSQVIMLHEYAHHYLMSVWPKNLPRWFNEGAAEFFASARFIHDGTLEIGKPAYHRANDFGYAEEVPLMELFDPAAYKVSKEKNGRYDMFYGMSWALYHYMHFNKDRRGQVDDYLVRFIRGTSSPQAAQEAFGDLDQLEKEVRSYLRGATMTNYRFGPEMTSPGAIQVRRISEGHAAMMPIIIRSQRGVDDEEALALLPKAQAIAARYPDDPAVRAALEEAERDATNSEPSE